MKKSNTNDEQWKDAFEDASFQPDPKVWANIEGHLISNTNKTYPYQRAIAAAAMLILTVGSISYYAYHILDNDNLARTQQSDPTQSENSFSTNTINNNLSSKDKIIQKKAKTTDQTSVDQASVLNGNNATVLNGDVLNNNATILNTGAVLNNNATVLNTDAVLNPISSTHKPKANKHSFSENDTDDKYAIDNDLGKSLQTKHTIALHNTHTNKNTDVLKTDVLKTTSTEHTPNTSKTLHSIPTSELALQPLEKLDLTAFAIPKEETEEESKEKENSVYTISLSYMPIAYNQRLHLREGNISQTVLTYKGYSKEDTKILLDNELRQNVTPLYSYQTAIKIGLSLNQNWKIQSGFEFAEYKNEIKTRYTSYSQNKKTPTFVALFTENTKNDPIASPQEKEVIKEQEEVTYHNTYSYLGMPIKIGYGIKHKKFDLFLYTGITPRILLNNIVTNPIIKDHEVLVKKNKNHIYKDLHLQGHISLEASYDIRKHISINIEPTYQIALHSVTKQNAMIQSTPKSYGVNIGISYKFL